MPAQTRFLIPLSLLHFRGGVLDGLVQECEALKLRVVWSWRVVASGLRYASLIEPEGCSTHIRRHLPLEAPHDRRCGGWGKLVMKELKVAHRVPLGAVIFSALTLVPSAQGQADELGKPAAAQAAKPAIVADDAQRLETVITEQSRRLDKQDHRLSEQGKTIEALRQELDTLRAEREGQAKRDYKLDSIRAAGLPPKSAPEAKPTAPAVDPVTSAPAIQTVTITPPVAPATATPAVKSAVSVPSLRPAASGPVIQPMTTVPIIVAQGNANQPANPMAALPNRPVGEAPAMASTENKAAEVQAALPEGARVLTPPGRFVAESGIEYSRSSSNRLVFRGVEIVPGIQLGLVDANDVARDTAGGSISLRTGATDRIELAARIPYYYRHDRLTVLSQQVNTNQPATTQITSLEGHDIGDVEVSARYQINRGVAPGTPIFVGGLSVKSTTGTGPFDVNFDSSGISTSLATGSGFWAVSPSITMLYPSDPVVLYATLAYNHNFGRNINKTIGTTLVGNVQPGDSVSLSMGFGFALNPQFSFSLGFSNTYVFATKTELGSTDQRSNTAEVGALTVGWSYVFSPTFTLSTNFDFGVTSDAPGMHVAFRMPFVL